MWLVGLNFLSTTGTSEAVVTGVGVADTDFSFEVPMVTENPRVAVCHARTNKPSLITGVLQLASIRTEEVDLTVDTADIVLATMGVETEKMAAEAVAEPVSSFGLDSPMFPAAFMRECPCIELSRDVQCPFRGETYFETQIRVIKSIGKQVRFQCDILCSNVLNYTGNRDYQK